MRKALKIVSAALAIFGVVELMIRGTDASLYSIVLLFILGLVVVFARFIAAVINAYKAAFNWGADNKASFPEFEQQLASFNQCDKKNESASRHTRSNTANNQTSADSTFHDDRVNPFIRENDPFGEFLGD
ncbi:hypothetical protein J6I75_07285 [Pseudidiomarina sp. 1APP75-27a]|uniref:hypothetical protein n=1 Tax=Pseudidiomarina terrestris TaxID=2820060 RepID=UPI002B0533B3|nr:hypothetical protein [Pseudidiomarina sp. 1APP75-27a]MEA3588153.1 hypothetical protein [Pseudidiomarina sp. 1APP75-27a]